MCPKNLQKLFDGRSNIRCGTKMYAETWSGCVELFLSMVVLMVSCLGPSCKKYLKPTSARLWDQSVHYNLVHDFHSKSHGAWLKKTKSLKNGKVQANFLIVNYLFCLHSPSPMLHSPFSVSNSPFSKRCLQFSKS